MTRVLKQAPRGDFLDTLFGVSTPPRFAPRQTIGAGGTAIFGGHVESRETDSSLAGERRYKTFSEHLVDVAIIGASVRFYLNLIAKANWKVAPADDSPAAEEFAELVEEMLHDMATPFHRVVRRAATYRFYGFSVQEWTAKLRDDGNLGLLDIEPRSQVTIERWLVDRTGTVHGVTQRAPQTGEELFLPRQKLVYVVDDSLNDSPEGLGLFRHAVEPARRLRRYEQLEGFGFETDLRGIPVTRVPHAQMRKEGMSDEDIKAFEEPLRSFAKEHIRSAQLGLTLDSKTYETQDGTGRPSNVFLWDVELLKASSTSQAESHTAIERVKREIAVLFGTEHLLLGSDAKGSFALSADKANNLAMTVDSINSDLCHVLRSDVVARIFQINGWDKALMPDLNTDKIQWRDIEQVTRALKDVSMAAGPVLMPGDDAITEVFELLGLTPPRADEIELDASLLGRRGRQEPEPDSDAGDDVEDETQVDDEDE